MADPPMTPREAADELVRFFDPVASTAPTFPERAFWTVIDNARATSPVPESGKVILFKPSGKFYTEEQWRVPANAVTPYDMIRSPDFRRINGGAVLVVTQEPWGYPHLLPASPPAPESGDLAAAARRVYEAAQRDELRVRGALSGDLSIVLAALLAPARQ